ncbi:MAG: YkgJ family cysteine cluster protein [Burkholderiales bacterium]|nr:YkgJ family cysteine cluster protein [Burkholderiales bacterium]
MLRCTDCGACCATFRVDFSVQELIHQGGAVPDGLADQITAGVARMRGTDQSPARCAALGGEIGRQVLCHIYEWRPGPCREFRAGDDACQRARRRHGLPPLPNDGRMSHA